jgi:hypothetical protein
MHEYIAPPVVPLISKASARDLETENSLNPNPQVDEAAGISHK